MYIPVYTKQFSKDIKKAQKRGKNLDKFKIIAKTLLSGEKLDAIHRDHSLIGNYVGRREFDTPHAVRRGDSWFTESPLSWCAFPCPEHGAG